MSRLVQSIVLALPIVMLAPPLPADEVAAPVSNEVFEIRHHFDSKNEISKLGLTATGEAARRMPLPKLHDGMLYLLESWMNSSASVGLPAPTDKTVRVLDAVWPMVMNTGTEGAGFVWLNTGIHGTEGDAPKLDAWEAPSVKGSFGIGLDASNPPNRDPFRGSGNAYDRPQHEVSLHWDGMEIVKRTTKTDFRDEEPHQMHGHVEFVVGGARVSFWIDDEHVFDRYFVPRMTAYVGRPAFGARNADTAGDVLVEWLVLQGLHAIEPPEAPLEVTALERVLNDKKHPKNEAKVAFPEDTDGYGRILMTLRLDKPETRFDPWDRLASVYTYADDGERFELLRYITPYHRGHVWHVDVTAFRPLLKGTRKIEQVCSTQGEGWVVTVAFSFYPGPVDRLAYRVVNLWTGKVVIGNPEKPVTAFYDPRVVEVDEQCTSAEVRTVVTGHGMSPNTGNAAEFMPIERTLTVNGSSFTNRLWKADNYLNPCRPQGGTWKYDRAGWAPGDVVRPWVVDATYCLEGGGLEIGYALAPYVNANRGKTWEPYHRVETQVILYRKP